MVHLPALLYPVRRRVSSTRRAALRRFPPCSGALRRGYRSALGAREEPWARRGYRRVAAGGLQGARSRGAGAKVLCRVGRAVTHPGPSPDPDKEMSTIRLFR